MANLVHLATGIVAPQIVVHRQIPVDVGVGYPPTVGTWREALHDIVKLILHVAELYIASISDGITDDTILGTGDRVLDAYGRNTAVDAVSRSGFENELAMATGGVLALEVDGIAARSEDFVANDSRAGACRCVSCFHSKSEDGFGDRLLKTTTILLETALVLVLALGQSLDLGQLLELELAPLDTAGQGNLGDARLVSVFAEPTMTTGLDVVVGIVGIFNVQDGPVGKGNGVEVTVGVVGILDVGLEVGAVDHLVLELTG